LINDKCKQVVVLYKDEFKELEQRVIVSKGSLALSPINTPKVDPFSYILE
jgi:hypothetical protein